MGELASPVVLLMSIALVLENTEIGVQIFLFPLNILRNYVRVKKNPNPNNLFSMLYFGICDFGEKTNNAVLYKCFKMKGCW